MNAFWDRASRRKVLETVFSVLKAELDDAVLTKSDEIAKFTALKDNPEETKTYQQNTGLTIDICSRIYSELTQDKEKAEDGDSEERIAVYGERALGELFSEPGKRKWATKDGCSPTDIIVVHQEDSSVLLGDCKFGLKSENAWIFRNKDQYEKEFSRKFSSVGEFLKEYDDVPASQYMLLIVTSSMAPLLINRFDDFKLDERYSDIPYDRIVICSVDDIMRKVSRYAM